VYESYLIYNKYTLTKNPDKGLKCHSRHCYFYESIRLEDYSTLSSDTLTELICYSWWISTETDLPDDYWEECTHQPYKR